MAAERRRMDESRKNCEDEDSVRYSSTQPLIQNLEDKPNLRRKGLSEHISMWLRSLLTVAFYLEAMPKSTSWQKLHLASFRKALITPRSAGCVCEEREKLEEPFIPSPPPPSAANQTRNSTFIFRDCSFHSNIQMKRLFPDPREPSLVYRFRKSRVGFVILWMNFAL